MTMEKKLALCKLAIALLIVNFILFSIGTMIVGGVFAFEKGGNGHYFVTQNGRGTEVSRPVFIYCVVHACSVCATHLIGIYAGRFYNKHKPPR